MQRGRDVMAAILAEGLVDTHYHVGPECIPRRYDVLTLADAAAPWRATLALKNHATPTTALAALARAHRAVSFVGGVVLNWFVGGLEPAAVHGAQAAHRSDPTHAAPPDTDPPMVVWMPTVHSASHIAHFGFTFDPRWSGCCAHGGGGPSAVAGGAFAVPPAAVEAFDPRSGAATPALIRALDAIASCNATLATGHLSADEILDLVPLALARGVRRIIITHPHYPAVALSDGQLGRLVRYPGVYIEHCYAVHTIEQVPLERFTKSILETGSDRVVLSTDFGQLHSLPFPDGSQRYLAELISACRGSVSEDSLVAMFSANGRAALGLTARSEATSRASAG